MILKVRKPHVTTTSTTWHTLSHDVRNDRAVSFQDSFLAQCARNRTEAVVIWCLPQPHGTASTFTPHCSQSTRRTRYSRNTQAPEGYELEAAHAQEVVGRGRVAADRTYCFGAHAWAHLDFDAFGELVQASCHPGKAGGSPI